MLAHASIKVPSTEKWSSDSNVLTPSWLSTAAMNCGDVTGDQALTVLGEHRDVPHHRIQRQPDKPAEQQIVVELLHQLPLRAYRVEGLQQQRAKQFLRSNRRPSELGVKLLELPRQCTQCLIHNLLDRPQRMIRWHSGVAAQIAEQRLASDISTAHRAFPHISSRSAHYTPYLAPKCHFFRILLGARFTQL